MSLMEIKREITTLSPEARAELAAFLCEFDDSELSAEWETEIRRRIQEVREGKTETIPHQQAMSEWRERFS